MRRLILDDMFPADLAEQLRARGRDAVSVGELGLAGASDGALAAVDGVLVTTVAAGGTVALVRAVGAAARRDVVHRHAHEMAAQRPGSVRRYA